MTGSLAKSYKVKNDRRFERLKASYLIRYWEMHEDRPDSIETSNTKDLSAGGVRFTARGRIRKGSVLRVQILIPPLFAKISAFAQVTNVVSAWPRKFHYVSAAFIEISREDFELLSGFIAGRFATRESEFLFDIRDTAVRTPRERDEDE